MKVFEVQQYVYPKLEITRARTGKKKGKKFTSTVTTSNSESEGGLWKTIASISENVYVNSGLVPGTEYCFRVRGSTSSQNFVSNAVFALTTGSFGKSLRFIQKILNNPQNK